MLYPTDKELTEEKLEADFEKKFRYRFHGGETDEVIKKITEKNEKIRGLQRDNSFDSMRVDIWDNGEYAHSKEKKPFTPMIFSHAAMKYSGMYIGQLREYASHGFYVIAIDHLDRSCLYTRNEAGKRYLYDLKTDASNMTQ